jgi:hypothetical protein
VSTIKSSREIDVMFRNARRAAHPLVIALAANAPPQRGRNGRVAYIAGKKLGGAVVRNRCRRVGRSANRQTGYRECRPCRARRRGARRSSARGGIVVKPILRGLPARVAHLPALGIVTLIRGYQRFISPAFPPSCRFTPTCSSYAITSIERYGLAKGGWLAARRLGRCHPWNPGGHDPVP